MDKNTYALFLPVKHLSTMTEKLSTHFSRHNHTNYKDIEVVNGNKFCYFVFKMSNLKIKNLVT